MSQPYVIAVSSEKGGVGKTTLATNLAIYLKGLCENLPITLFSFDNHFSVEGMFRIGKTTQRAGIGALLAGLQPAEDLLELGEYGVQFIASEVNLEGLRSFVKSPNVLAQQLASSNIPGIVIIDTQPVFDTFSQNALFAADKVLVPVKDASSLNNCKHLYQFCAEHDLPRKRLLVLPSLIDQRIRYDSVHKTPYELIRSFASARGYKCFDGFIGKDPSIEALNTNPEGKIYPIITHGRDTEVHEQYSRLAGRLVAEMSECEQFRLADVRTDIEAKRKDKAKKISLAKETLRSDCGICGQNLLFSNDKKPLKLDDSLFFFCSADQKTTGFLHEECLMNAILTQFYAPSKKKKKDKMTETMIRLFRETSTDTYFSFRRAENKFLDAVVFYRFNNTGKKIAQRGVRHSPFKRHWFTRRPSNFQRLVSNVLIGSNGSTKNATIVVRRVDSDCIDEILLAENHPIFHDLIKKADRNDIAFEEKAS